MNALGCSNEACDRMVSKLIEQRDRAEEWADKLAYAIAPESVIGEHSSLNNPWANAYERVTASGATEEGSDV